MGCLDSSLRELAHSPSAAFQLINSWGSICLDGVKSLAASFDTLGFQARAIHDLELVCRLFKIIKSIKEAPPVSSLKIGFVQTDLFSPRSTDDMIVAWEEAKQLLAATGVEVTEVDLGLDFEGWSGVRGMAAYAARAEIGVNLLANVQTGGDKVSEFSQEPVEEMEGISKGEVVSVLDKLAMLRPKIDGIAKLYDALITPSSPGEPGPAGIPADHAYVAMWTGLHVPMINIPGLSSKGGLPIGLTLVGPR